MLVRGDIRFVVDLGRIEGKRTLRYFRTRDQAEEHLEEQKAEAAAFRAVFRCALGAGSGPVSVGARPAGGGRGNHRQGG